MKKNILDIKVTFKIILNFMKNQYSFIKFVNKLMCRESLAKFFFFFL